MKTDTNYIVKLLNHQELNTKCNNYIFTDLNENSKQYILKNINPFTSIENINEVKNNDSTFKNNNLQNIIIDFKIIKLDILNYTLKKLKINKNIDLKKAYDILKFIFILRKNKKAIQFIMHNNIYLTTYEQTLINNLLWYNTYYFNSIILLKENEQLKTFQISKEIILENNENYIKEKVFIKH